VTTCKERPILFQAAMVRAILAGTKTQTRRVMKPQPLGGAPELLSHLLELGHQRWATDEAEEEEIWKCPYGQPGDRLWVREAFIHEPADYCWEASVSIPSRPASTVYRADCEGDTRGAGWKPSIHMPRALSRLTLEITGVRVERLQDISADDAVDEGIERDRQPEDRVCLWRNYLTGGTTVVQTFSYETLWESINGPGSWAANPWVWVVEFRRLPTQGTE
jgi:hypothetical protein